jgi:hypothetical protein
MKKLTLLLFLSFSATILVAQDSKFSHTEIVLQSRFLQQPDDFNMKYDLGIGTRLNYNLTPRLSLNLGGFLNFSHYQKDNISDNETLFIDFFKGSEAHYFVIQEVKQWCLETPLSLKFQFAELGKNQFSLLTGITPQFALNSQFSGFSFNEPAILTSNFTNSNYTLLNDILLNVGFSIVRPIDEQRNILLEFGYEHSTRGETNGLFIRSGIDF